MQANLAKGVKAENERQQEIMLGNNKKETHTFLGSETNRN
jgi:hypothetical protein